MVHLARLHREGWGVPQDYAKARELYEKAAAAGSADGMSGLGWLHQHGWGVPLDYAKAREFYEKGVAKGGSSAMNNIGVMHERGLGVPRDPAKAREWFERSAAAGNDFAMNNLGRVFENGWGAPQDHTKAPKWYRRPRPPATGWRRAIWPACSIRAKAAPSTPSAPPGSYWKRPAPATTRSSRCCKATCRSGQRTPARGQERELARLGHYKVPLGDTWDGRANMAIGQYIGQGADKLA